MYLLLSSNRAMGASSSLSGNYRPKYKIQPGLSLVEPDAERLVQMMEREKMRKMMLTARLLTGYECSNILLQEDTVVWKKSARKT